MKRANRWGCGGEIGRDSGNVLYVSKSSLPAFLLASSLCRTDFPHILGQGGKDRARPLSLCSRIQIKRKICHISSVVPRETLHSTAKCKNVENVVQLLPTVLMAIPSFKSSPSSSAIIDDIGDLCEFWTKLD